MNNQLEKFTFGKSPACLLLVDLINKLDPAKYRKLHTRQQSINRDLHELTKAYINNNISANTFLHIINMMRKEFKNDIANIKKADSTVYPTEQEMKIKKDIYDVFSNVVAMSFKTLLRELDYHKAVHKSCSDKIRSMAKKNKTTKEFSYTFNGYHKDIPYTANVTFTHGQNPQISITSTFNDTITNELLFQRHYKRMKRKNIQYD